MSAILAMLILFQFKHFLADFPLQSPYMLQKFKKEGWIKPLAAHAGVHAVFTFVIVFGWASIPLALAMALLDFVIHFTMDRIKAGPTLLGRFKALTASEYSTATPDQKLGNKYFWWALGLDQAVHHLTHYLIIFIVLS